MDLNCRFLFKVIPWNIQPRPVLPVVGVWMKLLVTFGLLTQEKCLQQAGIGNLASTAALIGDLTLRAKVQKITVCSKLGLETLHQEQQLVTSRLLLVPSIFKSPFRCNVKECNPIQREYAIQCNALHQKINLCGEVAETIGWCVRHWMHTDKSMTDRFHFPTTLNENEWFALIGRPLTHNTEKVIWKPWRSNITGSQSSRIW